MLAERIGHHPRRLFGCIRRIVVVVSEDEKCCMSRDCNMHGGSNHMFSSDNLSCYSMYLFFFTVTERMQKWYLPNDPSIS